MNYESFVWGIAMIMSNQLGPFYDEIVVNAVFSTLWSKNKKYQSVFYYCICFKLFKWTKVKHRFEIKSDVTANRKSIVFAFELVKHSIITALFEVLEIWGL